MTRQFTRALPLIIIIGGLIVLQNWGRIALAINPVETQSLTKQDVVLYSTIWCPYCAKTRDFLQAAGIPFTEYDIEKSDYAYQEYEALSGRGVPVLRIGERTVQGHNPGAIRAALDALPRSPGR